jgi:uncharacterized protein YceK
MKRILLVLLTAILLTGCNSVLDKKIDKKNFLLDLKEIKDRYGDKYSDKDLTALGMGVGLSASMGVDTVWTGTYRQALDKLKANREKAEADSIQKAEKYQRDYHEFITKANLLRQYIVLNINTQQMRDVDGMGLTQEFYFTYVVLNNSDEIISSFEGNEAVFDKEGNELASLPFTNNIAINPGNAISRGKAFNYDDTDSSQTKIKDGQEGDLKFQWQPTKIVFKSGTTMTAPPEPPNPGAN